ncbi:hypothetical protein TWF481_011129 [Arthrobotrys musiformis]|uniref:Armadillo repeat-containing protein 8 n=1 Tax=Arthrobotrys musiformis TaxID=47236 RepID=A0AAV9VYV3_9PEZI
MALSSHLSSSRVLDAIRSPPTRQETLHALKHIILGHHEQKLEYVQAGLVDLLLQILEEEPGYRQTRTKKTPAIETDVIIILGSLARGGSVFLTATQLERLAPLLLDLLESQILHAPLLEASLRTLNCILSLPIASQSPDIHSIVQNHPSTLHSLSNVLRSPPSGRDLAAYQATLLIPKTCKAKDNRWQERIVESGVFAALIKRLAIFVRTMQLSRIGKGNGLLKVESKPNTDRNQISKSSSTLSLRYRPTPAWVSERPTTGERISMPSASHVSGLLGAIAFIIRGSKFRADQCLFANCITNILGEEAPLETHRPPPTWRDSKPSDDAQGGSQPAGYQYAGQDFPPLSPTSERHPQNRSGSSGNALQSSHSNTEHSLDHERIKIPQISELRFAGERDDDPESPLIQWLISYIRHEEDSLARLTAISLLTDFVQAGCVSKRRVKKLGFLIVPMLVRYLDEIDTSTVAITKVYEQGFQAQEIEWSIREQAPAILATLLTDNQRLQNAAVEAGAIKRLTGMLKRAFDAIPGSDESGGLDSHESLWREKVRAHQIKVREGTLRALAAIALFEDDHRKKIIESGALGFVVGSLTPEKATESIENGDDSDLIMTGTQDTVSPGAQLPTISENDSGSTFTVPETSRTGNPISVLIAATNVVRSLSRSVNVLSTSLIDWHVSEPLFSLLSHQSIQVKIAAAAALCNLVMEFSPLRKNLEEKGIVKALGDLVKFDSGNVCAYDRHGNSIGDFDPEKESLRLNAIWALKHLVLRQDESVILNCLSALGTTWLLEQLAIEAHFPDHGIGSAFEENLDEGRQVLKLHSDLFSPKIVDRLALNYAVPKPDDVRRKALVAFQEQALDFFRNIMAGANSTATFKYILGETKDLEVQTTPREDSDISLAETSENYRTPFYDIITEKLKSKPGEKIVLAIIYVLVHIGACAEHRTTLIEQSSLFQELIKLFEVQADQVRIGLSWLAINLTWRENGATNADFTRRVQKLREYKYVQMLEWLRSEGTGESDHGNRRSSSSRGFSETAVDTVEVPIIRNAEGEIVRTGLPSVNMSLDLRERCRQALAQINDV